MTLWQHPNFFAYYPSEKTHAGVLGEMTASLFNNPGFSW
jgi:aromatic-L-amino-acid decarboxylase